jgi:hypothetical protein
MKVTNEKKICTERIKKERYVAEESRTDEKRNTPNFKETYLKFGK